MLTMARDYNDEAVAINARHIVSIERAGDDDADGCVVYLLGGRTISFKENVGDTRMHFSAMS